MCLTNEFIRLGFCAKMEIILMDLKKKQPLNESFD